MPLQPDNEYLPDFSTIPGDVTSQAVLMRLNYPNDPTGATANRGFFAQAGSVARQHRLLVCHDEPYCDVTLGPIPAPSVLQVHGAKDVAVEFNSLSKTFNRAGWRLGMAVGNVGAISALRKMKSNVDSGIFQPVERAAVTALAGDRG